jgi:hypothetical protein
VKIFTCIVTYHGAYLAHNLSAVLYNRISVGLKTPIMVNASVSRPLRCRMACPSGVDHPVMAKALLALATSPQPKSIDNTLAFVQILTLFNRVIPVGWASTGTSLPSREVPLWWAGKFSTAPNTKLTN